MSLCTGSDQLKRPSEVTRTTMHEVSLHSILNEVVMEKVVDRVLAHRERFSRSERSGRALSVMSSIETPPRSESGYF